MSRPPEYRRAADIEIEYGVPVPGRVLPKAAWSETLLKSLPPGPFDWQALFGRAAPVVLDLGCGNGRYLLGSALARPDYDHLGVDRLSRVIRYARQRGNSRGLRSLRFAVCDAHAFLVTQVPPHSVAEIHLYPPQPFHEAGAMALRLLTPAFVALAHQRLVPGGLLVVQTDTEAYYTYLRGILPAFFAWEDHPAPWPDAPRGRTRREIIARREGLAVFRGLGTARSDLTDAQVQAQAAALPLPRFHSEREPRRTHGKPARDAET